MFLFLQEKRASEAKERLEEAKRKLREEKEHLKDELRKQKESARHPDDRMVQGRPQPKSDGMKPWMLWDLIILGLVLALFIVAMVIPRGSVSNADVKKMVDDQVAAKVAVLEASINDIKANMTVKSVAKPSTPTNTSKKIVLDDANTAGAPVPLVDFKAYMEDASGNSAGEIEANGSDVKFSLIIEGLDKNDPQVCKIDRVKDGEETKDFASNVIVKVSEKDKSTYTITEKGTTNFIFRVRCAFAEYNDEQKLEAVTSYSQSLEAKVKIILN
ncbi:MAG TPA: hypothetical protein VJB87_00210, partial [Candidatus Nanoarchaeia archaeon]|nr:hypothetical protein [Candidatus Nanoarchaeia archaeon]